MKTLFDKVWDQHVIAELGDGMQLLHVDRHILNELSGARAMADNAARGLRTRNPELTMGVVDHVIGTDPGRRAQGVPWSVQIVTLFRAECARDGVRLLEAGDEAQGIEHVVAPELGYTLPGTLLVCGDSHTCTNGALGALAWGIGSSEVCHALATQAIVQQKPKTMRVTFKGDLPAGVSAKDMILALIGKYGTAGGRGYGVEYAGPVIRALGIEGRMTLCNLSIEFGAKVGMVAPDEKTYEYVKGRRQAPEGALWQQALEHWRTLPSDSGAKFDAERELDCSTLAPQVTWGTSPEDVVGVDGVIPDAKPAALEYMGLAAGQPLAGTRIDRVFIGSCTNSRISDLRAAAEIARGRKVAGHVEAWVVPGSMAVKREAEREGLDAVFLAAGFQWREPGCSMCVAANGEVVEPGARCVSTSNRNFVGRQGPGARTHLASPVTAAASAIAGEIADFRRI